LTHHPLHLLHWLSSHHPPIESSHALHSQSLAPSSWEGVDSFRSSYRLSLQEILQVADADSMFQWRCLLHEYQLHYPLSGTHCTSSATTPSRLLLPLLDLHRSVNTINTTITHLPPSPIQHDLLPQVIFLFYITLEVFPITVTTSTNTTPADTPSVSLQLISHQLSAYYHTHYTTNHTSSDQTNVTELTIEQLFSWIYQIGQLVSHYLCDHNSSGNHDHYKSDSHRSYYLDILLDAALHRPPCTPSTLLMELYYLLHIIVTTRDLPQGLANDHDHDHCDHDHDDSVVIEDVAWPRWILLLASIAQLAKSHHMNCPIQVQLSSSCLETLQLLKLRFKNIIFNNQVPVQDHDHNDSNPVQSSSLDYQLQSVSRYCRLYLSTLFEELFRSQEQKKLEDDDYNFDLQTYLETVAQEITQWQLSVSLQSTLQRNPIYPPALLTMTGEQIDDDCCIVHAIGSVRIDLAGGWSDTPPICYDTVGSSVSKSRDGGKVCNVAVLIDDQPSLRAVAAWHYTVAVSESAVPLFTVTIQCYRVRDSSTALELDAEEHICDWRTLRQVRYNASECALPKACLLLLCQTFATQYDFEIPQEGSQEETENALFAGFLSKMFARSTNRTNMNVAVNILCVSALPAGSGMGTSSILAAVILQAIYHLVISSHAFSTAVISTSLDRNMMVSLVTQVEQLMATGGGWQDQVGGIFPGFKLASSRSSLPLEVTVKELPTSTIQTDVLWYEKKKQCLYQEFSKRTYLVYTGQQVSKLPSYKYCINIYLFVG
jgi:hypothetical protein